MGSFVLKSWSGETLPSDRNEWEALVTANKTLAVALEVEMKFDLLMTNFFEFEKHLVDLALRQLVFGTYPKFESLANHQTSNRLLFNLLSTGRLYIEQIDKDLVLLYGSDSAEETSLNESLSKQYDKRFGYRFMELLRNYAQHRSIPVTVVQVSYDTEQETPDGHTCIRYRPMLKFDKITEWSRLKGQVRGELRSHVDSTGSIDLVPHVRDYIEGLNEVHSEARCILHPRIESAETIVNAILDRWRDAHGVSTNVNLVWHRAEEDTDEKQLVFPEITARRQRLEERNSAKRGFRRLYVSNRDKTSS